MTPEDENNWIECYIIIWYNKEISNWSVFDTVFYNLKDAEEELKYRRECHNYYDLKQLEKHMYIHRFSVPKTTQRKA